MPISGGPLQPSENATSARLRRGITRAQRAAEQLMQDTCTITRTTASEAFDEETGTYAAGTTTTVYEGPCRVRPRDNADRVVQYGEEAVSFWPFVVSVPMGVVDAQLNDIVTITAAAHDDSLADQQLRIREVLAGTHLSARRLACERNAG